jgi:DNA-binding CsgD family transcriptional regulator
VTIRLLTPTEQRVAQLVASGCSTAEVAVELALPAKTVEWHLSRVCRKLGARSRAELSGLLERVAVPGGGGQGWRKGNA